MNREDGDDELTLSPYPTPPLAFAMLIKRRAFVLDPATLPRRGEIKTSQIINLKRMREEQQRQVHAEVSKRLFESSEFPPPLL